MITISNYFKPASDSWSSIISMPNLVEEYLDVVTSSLIPINDNVISLSLIILRWWVTLWFNLDGFIIILFFITAQVYFISLFIIIVFKCIFFFWLVSVSLLFFRDLLLLFLFLFFKPPLTSFFIIAIRIVTVIIIVIFIHWPFNRGVFLNVIHFVKGYILTGSPIILK